MAKESLITALSSVDWNSHVASFAADVASADSFAKCGLRLAIWAKQIEMIEHENPAIAFVREMQIAAQYVPTLVSLALYKPAASAMRTMLETALYYTYFRNHPVELATLLRDVGFYIQKSDLVEYHNKHTSRFPQLQQAFGFLRGLNEWYKEISAIVHGQVPGGWVEHTAISQIEPVGEIIEIVLKAFIEGEQLVHQLFLCTIAQDLWGDVSHTAKKSLLFGLSGDIKTQLELDAG